MSTRKTDTRNAWLPARLDVPQLCNCLSLAAAPTFAIMALLAGVVGGRNDLLCAAAHDVSPFTGMAAMYLLMSIFHLPPWLKLMSNH